MDHCGFYGYAWDEISAETLNSWTCFFRSLEKIKLSSPVKVIVHVSLSTTTTSGWLVITSPTVLCSFILHHSLRHLLS